MTEGPSVLNLMASLSAGALAILLGHTARDWARFLSYGGEAMLCAACYCLFLSLVWAAAWAGLDLWVVLAVQAIGTAAFAVIMVQIAYIRHMRARIYHRIVAERYRSRLAA